MKKTRYTSPQVGIFPQEKIQILASSNLTLDVGGNEELNNRQAKRWQFSFGNDEDGKMDEQLKYFDI